jgi:hypothetical protein
MPLKSLRHLAEETSISILSAAKVMNLLKPWLYRVIVVHSLLPRDSARRIDFCNWFLQSVPGGEVDPHLTFFFSDEAQFYLHGYIFSQNNLYWSLIHKVPPHDVILTYVNGIESMFLYRDRVFSTSYNMGKLILFLWSDT